MRTASRPSDTASSGIDTPTLHAAAVRQLERLSHGDDAVAAVDGSRFIDGARSQRVRDHIPVAGDEDAGARFDADAGASARGSADRSLLTTSGWSNGACRASDHVARRHRTHESDIEDRLAVVLRRHLVAVLVEEEERRALLGLHRGYGGSAAVDAGQVLGQDALGVGARVVHQSVLDDVHDGDGADRRDHREQGGDENREPCAHPDPCITVSHRPIADAAHGLDPARRPPRRPVRRACGAGIRCRRRRRSTRRDGRRPSTRSNSSDRVSGSPGRRASASSSANSRWVR